METQQHLEDLLEMQTKQIVAYTLENASERKMAEEMKITRSRVRKIRNSAMFKDLLKKEGDDALAVARDKFKSRLESLAPLAYEALRVNLENNKIEAVKVFAEVVGLKKPLDDKPQDTTLQVFLPGAQPTDIKNVKSEVIE